jgi:hypothetical protein
MNLGAHSRGYKDFRLLGYDAVYSVEKHRRFGKTSPQS